MANGLYAKNAQYVQISHAYVETSGGPAIHLEDGKYSQLYQQLVVIDSSTVKVSNCVSGEESWFKAYTMELAAMQMKASINSGVSALGSRILRSITDPSTGLLSRKMDMIALVMPVDEQLSPGETLINNTDPSLRTTAGFTDMTIELIGNQNNYVYDYSSIGYPEPYVGQYTVPLSEGLFVQAASSALPIGDGSVAMLDPGISDLGTIVVESMIGVQVDFSSVGRGHLILIAGLDSPPAP